MKEGLHRVGIAVRRYLLLHFELHTLKQLAFGISLGLCLLAGLIILFSLFLSSLHEGLGFSYLEINTIALSLAIGMYFCLPVLGYLADSHGPTLLLILSIWFFCPSYPVNLWLVSSLSSAHRNASSLPDLPQSPSSLHVYGLSVTFFFIGLATSSLYFSALITCAKVFPERKGLAISLPVSCYGLSSLMGAQLLKLDYFSAHDGDSLDLARVFGFFAVLYFLVGILNFVSNCIVIVEQDIIFSDEREQLLDVLDSESLMPTRLVEPENHHSRYILFLKDPLAWLLLGALVLNLGPLEAYQNNLGLIIKNTTSDVSLPSQVSVMATASTFSRLAFGAASDWLSNLKRTFPICRVWLLILVIIVGVIGQSVHFLLYSLTTTLNGVSYGGMFTIYPTLVALIWGIDMMGSTWGSFMVAPAIGLVTYLLFYGKQVDLKCLHGGKDCLNFYFGITGIALAFSAVLVFVTWKAIWAKRGFKLF